MHFVWVSKRDEFFSPQVSESHSSGIWKLVERKIHLAWKTIQNAFSRILYTSRHVNHAKYIAQS